MPAPLLAGRGEVRVSPFPPNFDSARPVKFKPFRGRGLRSILGFSPFRRRLAEDLE
jgi:hypothetical protein